MAPHRGFSKLKTNRRVASEPGLADLLSVFTEFRFLPREEKRGAVLATRQEHILNGSEFHQNVITSIDVCLWAYRFVTRMSLLVAQCDYRIDADSAARRQIAGDQPDRNQQQCNRDKRHRIGRLDAVQQPGHQP